MKPYNDTLADVVQGLFIKGVTDPSTEEIVEAYSLLCGGFSYGKETTQGVAGRLHKIRDILENRGEVVHLVSPAYYKIYRENPPKTSPQAKQCLPMGRGIRACGVRKVVNSEDLIYQEFLLWAGSAASGAAKKVLHRIYREVETGRLTVSNARKLVQGKIGTISPDQRNLYELVLRQLPEPNGKD